MTSSSDQTEEAPAEAAVETDLDPAAENAAAGEEPEPPSAEETIRVLTEELAKAKDQWLRAVADTENVRKRSMRDMEESSKYSITAFARDMVNVLENMKRASESIAALAKDDERLKTIGEGVDLTLQELLTIFTRYNIKRVDPLNQKFDHNLHQAVVQVERDDVPPGTVIQVVQAGYVIHDRLLRPAMVAVSKQGETPKKVDTTA